MDTTNIAIAVVMSVIAFFTGMEVKEYQMKAEARAFVTKLAEGLAK